MKLETCYVERLLLCEGFGDIMYALGRYKDHDMLLLCEHHSEDCVERCTLIFLLKTSVFDSIYAAWRVTEK